MDFELVFLYRAGLMRVNYKTSSSNFCAEILRVGISAGQDWWPALYPNHFRAGEPSGSPRISPLRKQHLRYTERCFAALGSIRPRHAEDVLAEVGEDQVGRDRGGLVEPGLT